jgi:hypothetical protein
MHRSATIALGMLLIAACQLQADVSIAEKGLWPDNWPKELDSLRERARTIGGPLGGFLHYEIPFTKRAEFEAAWPHLLKVRSPEMPITLVKAPWQGQGARRGSELKAGIMVNSWPLKPASSAEATSTTTLVLVVDGDIVDLNRLPLPADVSIRDERFPEKPTVNEGKSPK